MRLLLVLLLLASAACGDPPWVGKFDATSTWNVSGPLAGGRTVGDAVADLLVGKVVGLAPVPGLLEDEVHELADELLRAHVKTFVDANAPASLQPGGALTTSLQQALGTVQVLSTIELDEATLDDMEGTETLNRVSFSIAGTQYDLAPADLLGGSGKLQAEWGGDEDDEGLEVDPHDVPLHFGRLVQHVAEKITDTGELATLKSGVAAALDCPSVVSAALDGDPGLTLSVSSWSHTIDASTFTSACESVKSLAGERALGMFALNAAVTLGGKITVKESGDGATLTSRAGFGGTVNVAPEVIAPRLTVTLSATRR